MTLLDARNLRFAYGDRPVLRDVSLTLAPGEIAALLGPNGAGKSTLIRLLLGQLHGEGEILWDGRDVKSWQRKELARRVAYLPQSPEADPQQLVQEVLGAGRAPYWGAFGIESERDMQVVREIAQQIGLTDLLTRPLGDLSGGQRQLVFLGRCLAQEPAALLLDEPNTYLDLRHQADVARMLRTIARERNIAVLMASHDLNLAAAVADRLVLLDQGVVAASGPPAEVLDPQLLTRVYGLTVRRIDLPGAKPFIVPEI